MTPAIFILLLAGGAALLVSLLLFVLVKAGAAPAKKSGPVKKQRPPARPKQAPQTAQLHTSSQTLSAAEREDMLEGVKNLAQSDPGRVAGLIRN